MLPYWYFDFTWLPWKLLWAGLVRTEGQVPLCQHQQCHMGIWAHVLTTKECCLPASSQQLSLKKSPSSQVILAFSSFLTFSFYIYFEIWYLLYIERYTVKETGVFCFLRNSGQKHSHFKDTMNCYNTDLSQVASRFSKKIKKSEIQASRMSKVELLEFSVEPGTHSFNNLPILQLWDFSAWGNKISQ